MSNTREVEEAKAKLIPMCHEMGCRLDELLNKARLYLEYGDYWSDGGRWEGGAPGFDAKVFWPLYEIIMDVEVPEKFKDDSYEGDFFSCSC